jgi:hypothetical protein
MGAAQAWIREYGADTLAFAASAVLVAIHDAILL